MTNKMDYYEKAKFHMDKLNLMHAIPGTFNRSEYKHHAVLCSLYMTLIDKEEKNNGQL